MTEPIPSAGETTIIGMPAITIPVTATATSDRPLTAEDLDTIARLSDDTALLISTRGAVSGSRYLLDEDEVTVGRDPHSDILLDDSTVSRAPCGVPSHEWGVYRSRCGIAEWYICEPAADRSCPVEERG